MKNKKRTFIILFTVLFIVLGAFFIYRLLQDENKLTVTEKQFITSNDNKNIAINVVNDANIFGNNGVGVFYEFLHNVEDEYNLSFSVVTTKVNDDSKGEVMLTKSSSKPAHATLIYTDHYVLISKSNQGIYNTSGIIGDVGVVSGNSIPNISGGISGTIKEFKTRDELINAIDNGDVVYAIVPRIEYLDTILSKGYNINYHFSDLKDYYYLDYSGTDGEILASIMTKYLNTWKEEFDNSFYTNEFKTFTSNLGISEKEVDKLNNKVYTYGFISNPPYDTSNSKTYGGIIKEYLDGFSKMGNIDIKYKSYKNLSKLKRAINKKEINIYTDYYGINSDYAVINSLYNADISIVMNDADERVYTSLDGIKGETLYAKKNSLIARYLSNQGIKIKTYRKTKDIKKLLENNNIVAIDKYEYEFYQKGKKLNSSIRFTEGTNQEYNIESSSSANFNKLLASYVSYIDKNEVTYNGLNSASVAEKYGKMIYRITKYASLIIIAILAITYILYRHGKKIHIKKKIKKADKIKYVDLLTSLKNRNYLNENIPVWNRNTIYPQAIIVANLNEVQNLNDDYGYEAGDKQIKAVANVLIKTQLDNSEIMRADGNEFIIYLVGYSEKRVLSYIKKLNKEFKNLPYDRGVAIGFSIIDNDLKLVDDAINEATEKMKGNKELMQGDTDEKEDK